MRLIRAGKTWENFIYTLVVQALSGSNSRVNLCLQTKEGKDIDQVRAGSKQTKCQGRY